MTGLEKNGIISLFEDLYFLEKQARDLYDSYLKEMTDENDKKIVSSIRDEEIKHMEYASEILRIIKSSIKAT